MEEIVQALVDRTRARLNMKLLKTIFGAKGRPNWRQNRKRPRLEVVVERPQYDLTIFKLHFGKLTLKVYTKGERVLRIEVVLHNAKELRCGRLLEKFPPIVTRLKQIANQFLDHVYAMDATFVSDATLDELPQPSCLGKTKIGGIDINRPRTRTVLNAALSLACAPRGFTVGDFAATQSMRDATLLQYDARRAAYDLKKLRAKKSPNQAGPLSPLADTPFHPKPSALSEHWSFSAKRSPVPFSLVSASGKPVANLNIGA